MLYIQGLLSFTPFIHTSSHPHTIIPSLTFSTLTPPLPHTITPSLTFSTLTPSHHHSLSPHTLTPSHPLSSHLTPSLPHTLTRQLGAVHQTPSEHASQLPTATEVWAWPGCAQDEGPPRLAQPAVEGGLHGTVLSGTTFNSHCCTPL